MGNHDWPKRLQAVADARGINKKKELLCSSMKDVFLYAYDPFRRYGVRKFNAPGLGGGSITDEGFSILDHVADGTYTGHYATILMAGYANRLTRESAELYCKIINKGLRAGISSKTINAVFPGLVPTHDVMLAKQMDATRAVFPALASIKVDGLRGVWKGEHFYTRNGHKIVGVDHLAKELQHYNMVLDGELLVPGKTFYESSGLIRSNNPTPEAQYYIFDLPNADKPFFQRAEMMKKMQADMISGIHKHRFIKNHRVETLTQAFDLYAKARKQGHEGLMLKTYEHYYQGKRSWDWMKLKNVENIDLPVKRLYEGEGKYTGMLGGIVVEVEGVESEVGTGFSDHQRKIFWEDPTLIVGLMCEIAFHEYTPDGCLREPRFLWLRPDLD